MSDASARTTLPRTHANGTDLRRLRLWAEMALLYVLAPVALAVFFPANWMFPVLFAVTALGLVLLHVTRDFEWVELLRGWHRIGWGAVLGLSVVTFLAGTAVMMTFNPQGYFWMVQNRPELMLTIALLYPFVSALPQEIVFRPLFFRRYAELLPGTQLAILANAALFSLAHMLYWNWVVTIMTFFGGLAFAWAYEVRRNFPMAVVLHAVSGVIVFAVGLGMFFYTGNIQRPF
ncbi:CPBP family intramembrane glutamic endopeptidase [Halodurantibacterium flavum]|uniref:CPBP family intramembrane glutamic endopeptidase n=1 Tax=Halodurantibacterium flavum TaxID=1382802 RepID=A0ABW4S710_9RHOB